MDDFSTNETLKSIYRRRSIRQFQDKPVEDSLIQAVLDAANQAPSAHNKQSWRFIVISGEFMAVIPLGYSQRGNVGPRKKALEYVVKKKI
jgi:nitroreductase